MSIISGYQKIKKMIKTASGYQLLSHWTSSNTVEMDDGTTLEQRISNVDNTADQDKPVSTAQQNALDQKADITSPALTGMPTAPTPPTGTNTDQIATTEFVQTAVSNGTDGIITEINNEDTYINCDRSESVITITHKDASRADTSSTATPSAGDTFTAIKSISSDTKGHVTGVETETVTLPSLDVTGLGLVSTSASQGLSDTEKLNARENIGASSFSGSYADLSNTPTSLPANGGTADYLNVHLIPANVNLNNYKTPGLYYCDANATVKTLTNCPTTNAFYMIVGKHAGFCQEIIEYRTDNPKRFMRNFYNNAWSSWFRVYTEANKPTASEVGALASNTIIPVSNGGTGKKELVDKQVLVGNGTSAVSQRAIDTTPGGTANSESLITSDAVNSGLAKKANNDFKVFRKNETGNFSKTSVTVDSGYTAIMAISQAMDNKVNVYSKNFSQSGTVVTVELSTTCNAVYTTVLCVKS